MPFVPLPHAFDVADALQNHHWLDKFGATTLKRAENYVVDRRVNKMEAVWLNDSLVISAQVKGSERSPYYAQIAIRRHGAGFHYACECNCPVGVDCKHAAAALMLAEIHTDNFLEDVVDDVIEEVIDEIPIAPPTPRGLRAPARATAPAAAPWQQWMASLDTAQAGAEADPRRLALLLDVRTYPALTELVARLVWVQPTRQGRLGKVEAIRPRDLDTAIDTDWHGRLARLSLGELRRINGENWYLLSGRHGEQLLTELLESPIPRFWQKPSQGELHLAPEQELAWGWQTSEDGQQQFRPQWPGGAQRLLRVDGLWLWDEAQRSLARLRDAHPDLTRELLRLPAVPPEHADTLAAAWRSHPRLQTLPPPRIFKTREVRRCVPVPVLRLLERPLHHPLTHSHQIINAVPCVRLEFDYDGITVEGPADGRSITRLSGDTVSRLTRDAAVETKAQNLLPGLGLSRLAYHPVYAWRMVQPVHLAEYAPDGTGFPLTAEDVLALVDDCEQRGFRVVFDPSFPIALKSAPEDWVLDINESASGEAWFDAELGIDIDGERVSLLPILHKALGDRRLSLQPAANEPDDAVWLAPIDARRRVALPLRQIRAMLAPLLQWLDGGESVKVPRVAAGLLNELAAIEHAHLRTHTTAAIGELAALLREGGHAKRVTPPKTLKADLRPYQRDGLDWLGFLARADLGGVLADDMGLGKTVQVLAHLLSEKQARRLQKPVLIVAPTSVVGNWREQAARFAPSLKLRVLQGSDRHGHFESLDECDVAVTSYALLPRDRDMLRAQSFSLIVFDEAQALKNARSQAALVARELRATRRLAVTGTPVENHLGELWAQFDCVLPGLLGDSKQFVRHFRTPIEKHGNQERQQVLNRRIAPFLLRRTKEQVAQELPPKTEVVHTLELSGKQRTLYETLRLAMHEKVQQTIAKRGLGQSSIVILDALLKLRQVCCHPGLVKLAEARKVKESAKLEALMPMLEELLAEGRRILLFSQFTQMLDLIEDALRERDLSWLRLDGSTRDRDTPIARFQAEECPLFLISLKAGGVGLNLTAADTVIHFDPWWNPAVERQATDRAHRIGQNKPVFVYKFICAGTVEEKIQQLQQRKAELAEAVLAGSAAQHLHFDEGDIAELFSPLK